MNAQNSTFTPATDRQLSFISDLFHAIDPENAPELLRRVQENAEGRPAVSKTEATKLIKTLIEQRDKVRAQKQSEAPAPTANRTQGSDGLEEGFYRAADGRIFQVFQARNGSHMLAKLLNNETGSYDYAGAARRFVKPDQRMTLEEAQAYGKQTGRCMVCSRTLTAEASVEAGIGPICAKRF